MYTQHQQSAWTPYFVHYPYGRSNYMPSYHTQVSTPYLYQNPYAYSYPYPGYTEGVGSGYGQTPYQSVQAGSIPKHVISYFQDEEGQLDLDKMMSTTGQVMKTVQQMTPIVKGIGTFVKGMK